MTDSKPSLQAFPEEHLSADTLYHYLEGDLAPEAAHAAERHLVDCDLCAEALEGLSTVSPQDTQVALFDLNRAIKTRISARKKPALMRDIRAYALAAAIVFLLLFSALVVWYTTKLSNISPPSDQGPTLTRAALPAIGRQAYENYLEKARQYPAAARKQQVSESVHLSFIVRPDSTISQLQVVRDPGFGLGPEAIRLVRTGPRWLPALNRGKATASRVTLEIPFRYRVEKQN